jgi:hypothetical protein
MKAFFIGLQTTIQFFKLEIKIKQLGQIEKFSAIFIRVIRSGKIVVRVKLDESFETLYGIGF